MGRAPVARTLAGPVETMDTQTSAASGSDKWRGRITEDDQVILRLLQVPSDSPDCTVGDRIKRRRLMAANDAAVQAFRAAAARAGVMAKATSVDSLRRLTTTVEDDAGFLRAVFYRMPYAALAGQAIGVEQLMTWGDAWSVQAQLLHLEEIAENPAVSSPTKTYCDEWTQAIGSARDLPTRMALLNSDDRWRRLEHLHSHGEPIWCGQKPEDVSVKEW